MKTKGVHPLARSIRLNANNNREIFLIHGYTASPTDFGNLSKYLHRRFRVNVYAPLLDGHGTSIDDLYPIKFEDFLAQMEKELKKELKKGKKIIIGGTSFGAQLALILATKYPVLGVFASTAPHKLKFPLNLVPTSILRIFIKSWDKNWHQRMSDPYEQRLRRNSFYYKYIPLKYVDIMSHANHEINKTIHKLSVPTLFIQSVNDPTVNFVGARKIFNKIKFEKKRFVLFDEIKHNLFFSSSRHKLNRTIGDFIVSIKQFNSR